jgi:hypothetical protein
VIFTLAVQMTSPTWWHQQLRSLGCVSCLDMHFKGGNALITLRNGPGIEEFHAYIEILSSLTWNSKHEIFSLLFIFQIPSHLTDMVPCGLSVRLLSLNLHCLSP